MKIILEILLFPIKLIAYILIWGYKILISPFFPKTCIYYPTCSSYMLQAIKEFGIFKGIYLGTKRLFRCNPKHKGGEDYLPLNIKGEKKWVF